MAKIWEFFENMNEAVYVSDMDTYEIVYMNKKALESYGLQSLKDTEGKKCYEVLQGSATKCTVCTNPVLKEGCFMEWRYFNPRHGKTYGLKDTLVIDDGRRLRMNIAFNAGKIEQQSDGSFDYHNMEKFVNEAIRVAMKAPTSDHTINILIEYIGKICNADRTYIIEQNSRGNDDNTYEWVASGITSEKENLQDVPAEVCAYWYKCFRDDIKIVIKNVEEIKDTQPLTYEVLKPQNITSLVVEPLTDSHNNAIGFFGVDNPKIENLEYITDLLQIMGSFIASTMMVRNLVGKLYSKSHTDQLTGFGNRYSMNSYISKVTANESIGVVYCDITGLKRVNDLQGHDAGDKLILRACKCLSDSFGEYGLFRIGGDELLVLCRGIDEVQLNRKVQQLKDSMALYSVVMAVGTVWHESCSVDLDELLNTSEALMRKEKDEYYRSSGIERRK